MYCGFETAPRSVERYTVFCRSEEAGGPLIGPRLKRDHGGGTPASRRLKPHRRRQHRCTAPAGLEQRASISIGHYHYYGRNISSGHDMLRTRFARSVAAVQASTHPRYCCWLNPCEHNTIFPDARSAQRWPRTGESMRFSILAEPCGRGGDPAKPDTQEEMLFNNPTFGYRHQVAALSSSAPATRVAHWHAGWNVAHSVGSGARASRSGG
jgi:hypothetical protein